MREIRIISEQGASLDAVNVCGLAGKVIGGASELNVMFMNKLEPVATRLLNKT